MSEIIIPNQSPDVSEKVLNLRKRYESDEAFRKVADEIHSARMLPPPVCDDCLILAELRF